MTLPSIAVKIGDILKNILNPLPATKQHPKDITTLFKEPVDIQFQPEKGIESLIANPRPPLPLPVEATSTFDRRAKKTSTKSIEHQIEPQFMEEELPMRIMVQSSDSPNNYTVTDYYDEDESWTDKGVEKQEVTPNISLNRADKSVGYESARENRGAQQGPEISTMTQLLKSTPSSIEMTTPAPNERREATKKAQVKEPRKVTKQTKGRKKTPSLDRIAERVFERYKNHEDIPSYEDLWYDDNGEMLWSQEESPAAKNVKRQVDNGKVGQPVDKKDAAKEELERIHEATDVIDRFRGMLDIAQQVDYYLTKRLQTGINALAAMYADSPPHGFSHADRR